jgi:FkbM family methyltransferase
MRTVAAEFFKFLFQFSFFKKRWFGIYKRIFRPLNLFRGVTRSYTFRGEILFELHLEEWIQQNIFFLGEYETSELNFLESTLKKGDTFIDVGANIGVHTLVASKKVGETGKVISFEPFPKNNKLIQKNIELNNTTNVQLERFAICDNSKSIPLFYNEAEVNQGMASSYATEFSLTETVEAISLDEYLKLNPIEHVDLIKIDIEGGEYPALQGMTQALQKLKPTLLIELDDDIIKNTPFGKSQIIGFLMNLGYKQYFLDRNGNLTENEKLSETKNCVFKIN